MAQQKIKFFKVIFFIILLINTSPKTNQNYQQYQQKQNKDKQYVWQEWSSNINTNWLNNQIFSYISKAGFRLLVTPAFLRRLIHVSLTRNTLRAFFGFLIGGGLGAWRVYKGQYERAALQVLAGLAGATGVGIIGSLSIDALIVILDVIQQLQNQSLITNQRQLQFKTIQQGQIEVIDLKTTSFQTLQSPNLHLTMTFKSLKQLTLQQIAANYCHQNVCPEIQCPAGLTKVNKFIKSQMNLTQTINLTFSNSDCNQGEGIYKVNLKFSVKQENWKKQTVFQFRFNLTDLINAQCLVQYEKNQQLL